MDISSFSALCNFTILGDREWIPGHSVSACADNTVALGVLKFSQERSARRTQLKTGKIDCKAADPYCSSVCLLVYLLVLYWAPENSFCQLFNLNLFI